MIDLPYTVHTNNELALMLEGNKPLAIFDDDISVLPNELIIPEDAFCEHVAADIFLREERVFESSYVEKLGRNGLIKTVIFCVPSEQWRIPAMFLLKEQFYKTRKWNETLERIEGSLLGYTDEQNDIWCAGRFDDDGKLIS